MSINLMMKRTVYCVGSFIETELDDDEQKSSLYPDYLSEKGFNVITEPKNIFDNRTFLLNHVKNLEESSVLIFDATGDCGYNIPWDIGYLWGQFWKETKYKMKEIGIKQLVIIKIGNNCNIKNQWRMNQSIDNMKQYFDITLIKNKSDLKHLCKYLLLEEDQAEIPIGLVEIVERTLGQEWKYQIGKHI